MQASISTFRAGRAFHVKHGGFGSRVRQAMVAGSAGAQTVVNYATRTISATASAANPGRVSGSAGGHLTGQLDTRLLDRSTAGLIFRFTNIQTSTGAAGITNPNATVFSSTADIWFMGQNQEDRTSTLDGRHDTEHDFGYGGTGSVFASFVFGTSFTPYDVFASAYATVSGQGSGASANAFASATLTGVDAVAGTGLITSHATFDQSGNGVFAASTPEPSSLALLGSGLLGVIPFVRKRRRA